jgi:hypothetical protein
MENSAGTATVGITPGAGTHLDLAQSDYSGYRDTASVLFVGQVPANGTWDIPDATITSGTFTWSTNYLWFDPTGTGGIRPLGIASATVTTIKYGDAALTISPTVVATPQAMTKTQTATGVTVSPAPTATPQAMTKTQAATGITIVPAPTAAGEAWTTKYLKPDALLVQTGVTGAVANIQDSPTSPDGTYLSPSGGAIDVRMSFENNTQDMRTGTNDQILRVRMVKV